MDQKFECKHCGKAFKKSNTLSTHMCVKKQRNLDSNTSGFRYGLRSFQRFYALTTNSKKIKTQEEFIDSPYYIDFVKFGNHLAALRPVYVEQYIDFVIQSGLKMPKWTSDPVYELYIENLVKTEPPASAAERTISFIIEWCEKNNVQFNQFFFDISANEAAHLIKTGRISPWVFYLCESGSNLESRFNGDHSKMIQSIIDPGFWGRKLKTSKDDADYISTLLEEVGL